MKVHSQEFKENICLLGREQNILIEYIDENEENIALSNEEINSVNYNYKGNLLKSVMKELEIDSNINIPLGTKIRFKYGIRANNDYEYIDYGYFYVKSVEKQEDTESYSIICYDKMLITMVEYSDMDIQYPITIKNYLQKICDKLGFEFANFNSSFCNSEQKIEKELYLDSDLKTISNYTFRDVLDELAQVTGSCICVNQNEELEVRYIQETFDEINEEYCSDTNIAFGEKYRSDKFNSIKQKWWSR